MSKISIVTVNYNNATGLNKTFTSLFSQNNSDYEYIVIDGGSLDESINIINENSSKIDYWISEKDSGIYDAMNKGINMACGDYILFLNSGDSLFDENVLMDFKDANFKEDIIYGNVFMERGKKVRIYPATFTFKYLFEFAFCHQAMFFKRSLFKKHGNFNTDFKIVADWLFYLTAISKHNASSIYFNRTIASFNEDGLSSGDQKPGDLERQKALNTFFPFFKSDYDSLKRYEWRLYQYQCSKLVQWCMKFQASKVYKRLRNGRKG